MKRNYGIALLLVVALAVVSSCGGADSPAEPGQGVDGLAPAQQAKLSADLVSILEQQGSADLLVQADPQAIFHQTIRAEVASRLAADPAVIWKARVDGAVIWKLSPEQAVIWKMSTDKAVIWKLTQELIDEGLPIDDTYESIHAFKVHANLATVIELAQRDDIAYISPDRPVGVSGVSLWNRAVGVDMVHQRVSNTDFTGYSGAGIGIAVVDSGIKLTHPDFANSQGVSRMVAWKNFTTEGASTNVADNYGHGTHVAGLIAGNGKKSYDDQYTTTFEGVAPKANLIIAKVLDSTGSGNISSVISALNWLLTYKAQYNIRVVNISLGLPAADPWQNDPLCGAVENAVANGLVVVVAAGNYGTYNGQNLYGSIASPGIAPNAITVGATDLRGTTRRQADANGHNDDIASFSSRGPTPWDGLAKPDLVAPGVDIISAYAANSTLARVYPQNIIDPCTYGGANCGTAYAAYFRLSGTSMATPMVAGTAALLLEANPSLSPNSVKAVLMLTAQPLFEDSSAADCSTDPSWRARMNCIAHPVIEQGSGELNVKGAADLAADIVVSTNLQPGQPWVNDPSIQPVTYYTNTGDTVIWGQGLAWTGGLYTGVAMWSVYQEAYQPGKIWGTGLAWTGGVIANPDPVYSQPIKKLWQASFVNPYSIAGTNGVLGGYSYDWTGEPDYSTNGDAWFPEE